MLTQAAVSGAQDWLQGLKENVIIGRLIPARVTIPGMDKLLEPEPVPELAEVALGGWLGMGPSQETSEFPGLSTEASSEEANLLADVASFFGTPSSEDDNDKIPEPKESDLSSGDVETPDPDGQPQE